MLIKNYEDLNKILADINYKSRIAPISENNSLESLKIDFYPESRDEKLELIFTLFSPQELSTLLLEERRFSMLNITCFLPLIFDELSIQEAKLLANRINAIAILPGFCIDDNHTRVIYRFSMPLILDAQHEGLKATIDLIMRMIDIYGDSFIQIANGALFEDFVDNALIDYLVNLGSLIKSS